MVTSKVCFCLAPHGLPARHLLLLLSLSPSSLDRKGLVKCCVAF
jgi:hypothetical protein